MQAPEQQQHTNRLAALAWFPGFRVLASGLDKNYTLPETKMEPHILPFSKEQHSL